MFVIGNGVGVIVGVAVGNSDDADKMLSVDWPLSEK